MNQKIKTIYNKALESYTYSDIDGDNNKGTRLNADKFAELIILECVNIFEPRKVDDPKWSYYNSMLCMDIQDKIKEHFGIE